MISRVLEPEELELLLSDQEYSVEQIDAHLTNIANVITFSSRRNKAKCFAKADLWLDRRLQLRPVKENASNL